jgi:hypothetical protein
MLMLTPCVLYPYPVLSRDFIADALPLIVVGIRWYNNLKAVSKISP